MDHEGRFRLCFGPKSVFMALLIHNITYSAWSVCGELENKSMIPKVKRKLYETLLSRIVDKTAKKPLSTFPGF